MNKIVASCVLMLIVAGGCSQPYAGNQPVNLGPNVNSENHEGSAEISADGMTLYFDALDRPNGHGGWDIWMSRAEKPHRGFSPATAMAEPVNSRFNESGPCISNDGLMLYFASDRPGGYGDFDIWVTTRKTPQDPWTQPTNLGPAVNGRFYDNHPCISPDGLTLCFDSYRPVPGALGYTDIYMTTRATVDDPWGRPELLAINSDGYEYSPDIACDGLTLYYDSPHQGRDIWITRRAADESWKRGSPLGPQFNTPGIDTDPSPATDNSLLYFVSNRPGGRGGFDIWVMDTKKAKKAKSPRVESPASESK
ncbi:MAG: hypothetical protein ABFE01_22215 [Phycisphaerales bacterium]